MKHIEQANQEWKSTVDALSQVVCLLDDRGRILRANRALERWNLGAVTQVKGRPVHALFHPACAGSACPLERFWPQALEASQRGQVSVWEGEDRVLGRFLSIEVRPTARPEASVASSVAVTVIADITPRRRAEQALRRSERRYRALVDNSQGLICTHDLNGTLLSVNPATVDLLGYPPEEWVGKNLRDFLAPEMRPLFHAYLEQIRQHGISSGLMRVVTKGGEERVWMYRNILCEEAGEPPYVLGHAQDITELRASEERFRNLLDGSLQGVFIHLDGIIQFANPALARMFGYADPNELIGQDYRVLVAPEDHDRVEGYRQARLQDEPVPEPYEARGVKPDGTRLWFECLVSRVRWQGTPAIMSTFFDITARKQAEAERAEAHAQMVALVNQLRIGIISLDATGVITFLSEPCQRLLGQRVADVVGQPWQHVLPLEAGDTELHQVLSVLPLPRPARCSVRLAVQKGTRYWVDIDAQPDPRHPRHTILYFYDVSEVYDLRQALGHPSRFHKLIGQSLPMWRVYRQIQEVAPVDTTVLIEGETGTGKELVARAIHLASPRRDHPFLALNGGALGSDLLENQLFGHKRGAFTGAVAEQQGLFEAAHGGTLFLDEVGDLPLTAQTHLLRVLQEREITRLGETRPRKIDVRILAATQHDLSDHVRQGRFRADLLYRLCVVQIALPPLRQRPTDIPLLVQEFVAESSTMTRKAVQGVSREAMQRLLTYAWPGNVRELRSVIESAVIHCMGPVIHVMDLPLGLSQASLSRVRPLPDPANEKDRLLAALEQAGGNRRQAARLLGIGKSTLYRRFAAYGIASTGQ